MILILVEQPKWYMKGKSLSNLLILIYKQVNIHLPLKYSNQGVWGDVDMLRATSNKEERYKLDEGMEGGGRDEVDKFEKLIQRIFSINY